MYATRHHRRSRRARWIITAAAALQAQAAGAGTFTVTTTGDDDGICSLLCSLRQAITSANADLAASPVIAFAIPNAGVHVIGIASPLPPVTHAHVAINGYTQPGAHANSLADGSDAVIEIALGPGHGSTATVGLALCADSIAVRGLSIGGFDFAGIQVGDATVAGTGACGGKHPADDAVVEGNFLGLAPDGATARDNEVGVFVNDSAGVRIGGEAPGNRNVIAGGAFGVQVINGASAGLTVLGNYIGTDASGRLARGALAGVGIGTSAHDIVIGDVAAPNRIAFNHTGIVVGAAASTGNSLYANDFGATDGGIAIDLCMFACDTGDAVTANDVDDADSGANNLQNTPVLSEAVLSYDVLTLSGSLDIPHVALATPRGYLISAYANAACDASGSGPGEAFLGGVSRVFIDGGAITAENFEAVYTADVPTGSFITATATDVGGNTSELSHCIKVSRGDGIFKSGFDA